VKVGSTVWCSGQIPLDPVTMQLVSGDIDAEITRVFENLKAVAEAAGGTLDQAVKFNVYLTDLAHFARVNEIMARYVAQPYPARAAVQVAALPRGARVEVECVLSL
jgi:reactive intermediate/imine deaminase